MKPGRAFVAVALAIAVGLATGLSPVASSSPDGLQRVARDQGFEAAATSNPAEQHAPLARYAVPGIDNKRVGTGLAGGLGTLGVFAIVAAGRLVRRRRPRRGAAEVARA